jgi:hypothetical protein
MDTSRVASTTKSFVSRQIEQRSTELGAVMATTADDLRRIGDDLRKSATLSIAAPVVETGSAYVDRVGTYLQTSDSGVLIRDLESFARKQPWTIAGAAIALGYASARLLKSSSRRRYLDGRK